MNDLLLTVRYGMISYILIKYRVSQEECARPREGVPYVKIYRYNPKHLCPKLHGYGDFSLLYSVQTISGAHPIPSDAKV
jgi:hypothetical protein